MFCDTAFVIFTCDPSTSEEPNSLKADSIVKKEKEKRNSSEQKEAQSIHDKNSTRGTYSKRGGTSGGVYVPFIYMHARWQLL